MTSITSFITPNTVAANATPLTPLPSSGSSSGISFGDILDTLNPLQHIPAVSGLYRSVTGSSISATSEIAGDTLYGFAFGGPLMGAASAAADVAVKQISGADIGQHVLNTLGLNSSSPVTSSLPVSASAVPLVPAQPQTAIASGNGHATPQQQVANTLASLYHTQQPERSNAEYQRAQVLDAADSKLLKMAV